MSINDLSEDYRSDNIDELQSLLESQSVDLISFIHSNNFTRLELTLVPLLVLDKVYSKSILNTLLLLGKGSEFDVEKTLEHLDRVLHLVVRDGIDTYTSSNI